MKNLIEKYNKNIIDFVIRVDNLTEEEIKGHQIRTRGHPTYEINEPDIDFYKTLEKRFQQKTIHNPTTNQRLIVE